MKNCVLCNRNSDEVYVSDLDLCVDCMQDLIIKIMKGASSKKSAISSIERVAMRQLYKNSSLLEYWTIEQISGDGQKGRMERGLDKNCKIAELDKENRTAVIVGSSASCYEVSLSSCTCSDFQSRHLPCKHIFKLEDALK